MSREESLARRYLDLVARGRIDDTIHPADDMYLFNQRNPAIPPDKRRLEYFRTGRDILASLQNLFATLGRPLSSVGRCLEFACGYGRFTRFLVNHIPSDRILAADVLPGAVDFVGHTFGVEGRMSATDPSAVDLPSGFDLIFVVSLFSHLPRHRFEQWLDALGDRLGASGLLAFSTHNISMWPGGRSHRGFEFEPRSESDLLDPEEYGSTYVAPEVVGSLARDRGLAHHAFLERDIGLFQDLHVVAKTPLPQLASWHRTSILRGSIDHLHLDGNRFHLSGWAADSLDGTPLPEVRLRLGERLDYTASTGLPRPDVAEAWGREDWTASGWSAEGVLPELPDSGEFLSLTGLSRHGRDDGIDVRTFEPSIRLV